MKRYFICLVAFILAFSFTDVELVSASNTIFFDDFSRDSGIWEYQGIAYRDTENEYLVLNPAQRRSWGHIWLKYPLTGPFEVKFRYKAGNGERSGADGFAFLFYQEKTIEAPDWPEQTTNVVGAVLSGAYSTSGYSIEFDNYQNSHDPSGNHIALRDRYTNHLAVVNDFRTEDFIWHEAVIEVGENYVKVKIDSIVIINWHGTLQKTHLNFGFGAACGEDTNWAIIDDVTINPYPIEATPSVLIDLFQVFNDRVDVNTTHNIRLHAKWDNGSDVSKGLIYINGKEYKTNSGGWVAFNEASSVVEKKTWKVTAVNCSGVYDFKQTVPSPSIIWDRVNVTLSITRNRIDINSKPELTWSAIYEYDGSPFQGEVNIKTISGQTSVPTQVGIGSFTVESIKDEKYGLTSFTSNQVDCVWDRIKIVEGGVIDGNIKIGNMGTIWFKAEYDYDGIEFTGQDGVLYVNNVPLSWSSYDKRWKYSTTLYEPGSIIFEVTRVKDNRYGLTVIKDEVGPLTITWERPFWETPVGIISIGGIIVVIVSAAIFFLRKRI
ncbi:hypothetical protein KEJ47_07765 [Candidatus Bathyarchaeota archaeon]|nr:hypothetical protein [Candidatus Bathyarchaeota archaeon]